MVASLSTKACRVAQDEIAAGKVHYTPDGYRNPQAGNPGLRICLPSAKSSSTGKVNRPFTGQV